MSTLTYRFCDLTIASDIPIAELPAVSASADVSIVHCLSAPFVTPPAFAEWTGLDGSVGLSFGEDGSGYVLSFTGLTQFHVTTNGECVDVRPNVDTPP